MDYAYRLVLLFITAKTIAFIIAIISAGYLTPYNTHTELFLASHPPHGSIDEVIRSLLAPYCRWDSLYFLNIALDGYQFEQQHAFFPLLPSLMSIVAGFLTPLQEILSPITRLMLTGVLISLFSHFMTMVNIFRLTLLLGGDEYFAFLASAFCCVSPAFAYQNAVYSESLFSALVTKGMIDFYSGRKFQAAMMWSLSSLARSNGVLMAGFFANDIVRIFGGRFTFASIARIVKSVILTAITLLGYVAFQAYGYQLYCMEEDFLRPWCDRTIPDIYGFVQAEYWY